MKKLLLAALWLPLMALAQSYPSPTFNNVTVQGTLTGKINSTGSTITNATITGGTISGLSSPLPVASGGTNSASASGTALDNITGFASTGFMSRTGAGAYSFTVSTGSGNVVLATSPTIATPTVTGSFTATGLVTTADLATQAANTVLANATSSSAGPTAFAMPGCSSTSSALQWTSGTGFGCNSSINAASLGGATFAAPGSIGATTAGTGAFTSLTANTAGVGTNSSQVATTAFVANHDGCKNILDFGGNNGGSVDNSTAMTNAIAASPSGQACVFLPPGTYAFSALYHYTLPSNNASITIVGSGADVTTLTWAAGGGMQITFPTGNNSAHIRNLTFTTGTTNTGNGLAFNQVSASSDPAAAALSDVTGVTFRGSDGYLGTNYWAYGTFITGVSNVNFVNDAWYGPSGTPPVNGIGLYIVGSSSVVPVQFNIYGGVFNNLSAGIIYGDYVQGITVTASNFVYCNNGILVPSGLHANLYQLSVVNSQFGSYASDISILTWVPYTTIIGNVFNVSNNAAGVFMAQSYDFIISGNVFITTQASPTNVQAVSITASNGIGGLITNNTFNNFKNSGGYAVLLGASTSGINVQSNFYVNNATNVSNSGTGNTVGGGSQ